MSIGYTHFGGPVVAGTVQPGGTAVSNVGFALLKQAVTLTQNSTTAVTGTITLPANSTITGFVVDNTTVWNSGTSASMTVGTAAAGTQYITAIDVKALTGRATITYTAAQLTAMQNITTNITVYFTVTVVGATSAGTSVCAVTYHQNGYP